MFTGAATIRAQRSCRHLLTCLLLLFGSALADSPVSSCRITAAVNETVRTSTIPIPPDWRPLVQTDAVTGRINPAERSVTVRAIQQDGETIAFLCRFSAAPTPSQPPAQENDTDEDAEDTPKTLQLCLEFHPSRTADRQGPESEVPDASRPVHVNWSGYSAPSRPYNLRDFELLRARQDPKQNWRAQKGFHQEPSLRLRSEPRKIPTLAGHFRTLWKLDSPVAVRLGSNAQGSCWFLFVDGEPAGNWQSAKEEIENGVVGDRQFRLEPGLHSVDFFTVVKPREALPRPVFLEETGRTGYLDAAQLLPPVTADTLRFDQFDDDESPFRSDVLQRRSQLLFEDAPGPASLRVPAPFSADSADASVDEFPPRWAGFPRLDAVSLDLTLRSVPLLHNLGEPYICQWQLRGQPDVAAKYPGLLSLEAGIGARDGAVKARKSWTVDHLPDRGQLRMPLLPAARSLSVGCVHNQKLLVPEQRVALVPPEKFDSSLSFRGPQLLRNGTPASLLWQPGQQQKKTAGPQALRRLHLLDDALDVTPRAGQEKPINQWMSAQLGIPVNPLSIARTRAQGIPDRVAKFALMLEALKTAGAGDHVLFAVGWTDLLSQRPVLDLVAELDFLTQVCLARGLTPILLALPPPTSAAVPRMRRAALYTKELAARYNITVVDAYSAARLENWAPFFQQPGTTAQTGLPAPAQRLAGLILRTLKNNRD